MFVSSHQSVFLPWAGFWHKAHHSDKVIINSGSDFCRQDYEHRVKVNDAWLTLEIDREQSGKEISSIILKPGTAKAASERIARELYVKKNKYRHRLNGVLTTLEGFPTAPLSFLNSVLIAELCNQLQIQSEFIFIDEVPQGDCKTTKLYNRMAPHMEDGDTYICGFGALAYIEPQKFKHKIVMQTPLGGADTNSILKLLASVESPLEVLDQWFTIKEI